VRIPPSGSWSLNVRTRGEAVCWAGTFDGKDAMAAPAAVARNSLRLMPFSPGVVWFSIIAMLFPCF